MIGAIAICCIIQVLSSVDPHTRYRPSSALHSYPHDMLKAPQTAGQRSNAIWNWSITIIRLRELYARPPQRRPKGAPRAIAANLQYAGLCKDDNQCTIMNHDKRSAAGHADALPTAETSGAPRTSSGGHARPREETGWRQCGVPAHQQLYRPLRTTRPTGQSSAKSGWVQMGLCHMWHQEIET